MRIAVIGAGGVIGRGLVARLLSQGHDVVGISRHRPDSWPSAADIVAADILDAVSVGQAVAGADVVAHCAWDFAGDTGDIGGTRTVLDAMAETGTRRIVFASSVYTDRTLAEEMLANSGVQWVVIRCALVIGRSVDDRVPHLLAQPAFAGSSVDRPVQVVHLDDTLRLLIRAILDTEMDGSTVELAAPGELTLRRIAKALGRPIVPMPAGLARRWASFAGLEVVRRAPFLNTSGLRDTWGFAPAWSADECLEDFVRATRGRVALGRRMISLPWRVPSVTDVPAVDAAADDGVVPRLAGPEGDNGEFDTPIDPRFPTFLATNLSEALPGPFSPSSASVTVRGLRASGVGIAERLRPGGIVQREIAVRTVAVFAHRLYGAITAAHFMAETVPFVKPATVVSNSGFFGPSMASLPIFGDERPPTNSVGARGYLRTIRNIGVLGVNQICLTAGSPRDTDDFVGDIDRLEQLAGGDLAELDDSRLTSLILLARDLVVHGWVLASGSFMLSAVFNVMLRGLCGRDTAPPGGPGLVSARSVEAVHRLVVAAQGDPNVHRLLAEPGERLGELAVEAPEFYAAVLAELALIGHRGPAELEMASTSYSDDPELLVRMVAKTLSVAPAQPISVTAPRRIPLRAWPVALLATRQLRDREARRDKVVRANWVLRGLLREYGRRMVEAGVFDSADDVFYLLVDELDALPEDVSKLVATRRAEQIRLTGVVPPTVFSGSWEPSTTSSTDLRAGDTLRGVGVCGGRVRGRVRIVRPETIDDLLPGEILVAEVTDVGYTPAFCYAAAVVTELGGPMSHAAVVAREFGFPCVVDVHGATRSLPPGALIEVDGSTGEIQVIEL